MRLSRVLIAGAAVAAAGIATSAFTSSNTVEDSVAGYGSHTVTGVTTSDINYVLDSTKTEVTSIDFDVNENLDAAVYEGVNAWLQLQDGNGAAVGSPLSCVIAPYDTDHTPITCALVAGTKLVDFRGIALTVAE